MTLMYQVLPDEDRQTLRTMLTQRLFLSSSTRIACQKAHSIFVDGIPAYTNQCVSAGALITVILPTPPPMDVPIERAMLTVLYEDEALIAVDKPMGSLVHPSHAQYEHTLLSAVLGHLREAGQPLCAHPVHRLDRGTSGIVLFAKHPHVQARWMAALQQNAVQKEYEALAVGRFPATCGEIELPIAREQPLSMRRIVRPDGVSARTRYRVLQEFFMHGTPVSHVSFSPITGRTHQLRVHSLALGCPLLGDPLYGSETSQALSQRLALTAQLLHAVLLTLPHPLTGEPLRITSPFSRADGALPTR